MKNRVVRVPDDIWDAAQTQAADDGKEISGVIRGFLLEYGTRHLPHQKLHGVVPVPKNWTDVIDLDQAKADLLETLRRRAASASRKLVGEPTLIDQLEPFTYTDANGNLVVVDDMTMLKFEIDTVPSANS